MPPFIHNFRSRIIKKEEKNSNHCNKTTEWRQNEIKREKTFIIWHERENWFRWQFIIIFMKQYRNRILIGYYLMHQSNWKCKDMKSIEHSARSLFSTLYLHKYLLHIAKIREYENRLRDSNKWCNEHLPRSMCDECMKNI